MHVISTSTLCLVALVSLAGCDLPPHSIGSLETSESGDGSETDSDSTSGTDTDTGSGDSCVLPGVEASFMLEGLEDGSIHDLTLRCSASVNSEGDQHRIALADCSDPELGAYPELELDLAGDWPAPQVQGLIELRYLEMPIAVTIDQVSYGLGTGRWLVLRDPDTLAIPLIAVDAPATYPSAFGEFAFDYAPLYIDLDSANCELVPHPECEPMEPAALILGIDDEGFSAREGERLQGFAGNDIYTMIVERNREFVDDCFAYPNEHRFGVVLGN